MIHKEEFIQVLQLAIAIAVEMAAYTVLAVIVIISMSVSKVISECPPSSGKTLDVNNNNCFGFYRYLPDA